MKRINQVSPWLNHEELKALEVSITDKWVTEGPYTKKFLGKILDLTGSKYALPVPNGTLGLFLALLALEPKEGDEIIIPSFTFFGSASAAHFAGFKPIFCDVDPKSYMASLENIKNKISTKTKVVMPVNIYGKSQSVKPIVDYCKNKNIYVLEDSAQAIGVFNNGVHSGTYGDMGVISFFADKTITTGEGGVVLTQDKEIYERLKLLRNQGRPSSGTFVHPKFGMNFRITDMQAALGCIQLDKLQDIINLKRELFSYYNSMINDRDFISKPNIQSDQQDVPFRYYFEVSDVKEELMTHLENSNIQTRTFFYPMHLQPSVRSEYGKQDSCPVAESLFKNGICLPLHHDLTKADIDYIAACINRF